MKFIASLYLFIFLCLHAQAQSVDFDNYTPLRSQGVLPKEFSSSSVEKYKEAAKKISANKSKIEKEALRDYELESSYAIDDIFHSGKVLFNDTISNYVNSVMKKILEQREKKKNVRVYVLRSSVVNAFATGKGIIFITMGMLARMHNEAELAFVLSHEYIHYLKKHSVNEYIEIAKEKYAKGSYSKASIDDKYLRRANFSKEKELEADELGFDLYSKSGYDLATATAALNTILYYYLPFDSVSIESNYFESGSFKIPDNYFLKTYTPVDASVFEKGMNNSSTSSNDDDDGEDDRDKYSTHPSTDIRIEKIETFTKDFEGTVGHSLFLVSEESFNYIKKLSRFEIPRINLLDGSYEYAMYHAMFLLQANPNSLYLKKIIAKSLYSLAKYGNVGYFNSVHGKYKTAQGTFQQLLYLMGKLKAQGISAAAMNYCWKLKTENPDDIELISICRSMMTSIVFTYEDKKKRVFYTTLADTVRAKVKHKSVDDETADPEESEDNSKVKAKNKKAINADETTDTEDEEIEVKSKVVVKSYFKKAFIYWFEKDSDFTALFKAKRKEFKKKSTEVVSKKHQNSLVLATNTSDSKYIENNKVIFINPFYLYSERNIYSSNFDPIKSEENKEKFVTSLELVAKKTFSEYAILDQDQLNTDEAEKLSEISLLRECFLENLNKKGVGLVSTDLIEVKQIAKKYNSTNFVLAGMSIETMKGKTLLTQYIGLYTIFFYPIYLARNLPKSSEYALYAVMYNSDIDDFRVNYYKEVVGKDTPASLNANLFQIFSRIKTY